MTRLLATTALLGVLLGAPAWAQTTPPKMHHHHHHARHAVHHAASTAGSGSSAVGRHDRYVAGDHSANKLNQQQLQKIQNGG
jgi:hypothetical protein